MWHPAKRWPVIGILLATSATVWLAALARSGAPPSRLRAVHGAWTAADTAILEHAAVRSAARLAAGGAARQSLAARTPAGPARLRADARVEFVLTYRGCDVARTGAGPVPVGLIGLDRAQVARQYSGVVILSLTPGRVVMQRELPGCPGDVVTILAREGRVTVVDGRPGDLGALVARTEVLVRALGRDERLRLERGIVVSRAAWAKVVAELGAR